MAFRHFVHRFRRAGRAAMAASAERGRKAQECALARARNFRPEAQAYMGCAQRQAEAAALRAAVHLRLAHDRTFTNLFHVAYGESAPQIPSPSDVLQYLGVLTMRGINILNLWTRLQKWMNRFGELDPSTQATIASFFCVCPLLARINSWVPSAPESICPFLGIQGLQFDECPVQEGLMAVASLATTCSGYVLMFTSGLIISLPVNIFQILSKVNVDTLPSHTELSAIDLDFIKVDQATLALLEQKLTFIKVDQPTLVLLEQKLTPKSSDNEVLVARKSQTVKTNILIKIMQYSNTQAETRGAALAKLITFDQAILFDLILAANYLDIEGLRDLSHEMVAAMMKRKTLNSNNNFTPEEEEEAEIRGENQ